MRPSTKAITDKELDAFVRKVEALRAEGLSIATISQRVGLGTTAITQRLRKHRERLARVAE